MSCILRKKWILINTYKNDVFDLEKHFILTYLFFKLHKISR